MVRVRANCPGARCPGANCPGGECPRTTQYTDTSSENNGFTRVHKGSMTMKPSFAGVYIPYTSVLTCPIRKNV